MEYKFPNGFKWGTASSSYQIEGAWNEDGKGKSIWDIFTHAPGKIIGGENADVSIDHYHRYKEDIKLMAEVGLKNYRFSTSWPRIFPEGPDKLNTKGLDFYDRLVDELLTNNIEPYLCLYHWDLPLWMHEKGGWPNREIIGHFSNYAETMATKLGDRVSNWITQNEPFVTAGAGYFIGEHAPGEKNPIAAIRAVHHLLLSHGKAYQAIKASISRSINTGIVLNLSPVHPATDSKKDLKAAKMLDIIQNQAFLEPLLKGSSPLQKLKFLKPFIGDLIQSGDLELINQLDFLGVNYYSRAVVAHDKSFPIFSITQVHPEGNDYSGMWEIYPEGLSELLIKIWKEYFDSQIPGKKLPEIMVTENGIPVPDGIDFDGRIRDERRIRYLKDHINQIHEVISKGIPIKGYFVWSFMDNFEWAYGYSQRFGIVHVDFHTQKRTIKDSGHWFSKVIQDNGIQ
ncbi:MAG TPA: GH1 family beta-glucosidase [Anaerolineales bacterium]|nr:GH1 family beta-glucosidase [Anaerolineales bacterium]